MIDAHIHLHDSRYDEDRDAVIDQFFAAGGEAIINIGTSVCESRDAVRVAQSHESIFAAVGLHPHVFNGGDERDEEWMVGLGADHSEKIRMDALKEAMADVEVLALDQKVRAIGEIGLDYFLPGDAQVTLGQKKWQRTGFVVQIALAKKLGLPVVVHCRANDIPGGVATSDAYFDCAAILADYPEVKFVIHCYMGNVAVTKKLLALENVSFSFTGNVTYSKSDDDQMSDVLRMIPLERMMIETDGPYLTPKPHRGKRNDPRYVRYVAQRIADLKEISVDEVVQVATKTTKAFFSLSLSQ